METQQILERMAAVNAKMDAEREKRKAEMETWHTESDTDWAKLDADPKNRKADVLKAYEENRLAMRKADQERW
jgi:hypothetical protein